MAYTFTHTHTHSRTDIRYTNTYRHAYKVHVRYRAIRDTSVEDREQEDNTSAREHSYRKLVAIVSPSLVFFPFFFFRFILETGVRLLVNELPRGSYVELFVIIAKRYDATLIGMLSTFFEQSSRWCQVYWQKETRFTVKIRKQSFQKNQASHFQKNIIILKFVKIILKRVEQIVKILRHSL